ncbi:hypothetical protein FKM82_001797 [Ascaphus truei]
MEKSRAAYNVACGVAVTNNRGSLSCFAGATFTGLVRSCWTWQSVTTLLSVGRGFGGIESLLERFTRGGGGSLEVAGTAITPSNPSCPTPLTMQ